MDKAFLAAVIGSPTSRPVPASGQQAADVPQAMGVTDG